MILADTSGQLELIVLRIFGLKIVRPVLPLNRLRIHEFDWHSAWLRPCAPPATRSHLFV